MPRKNDGLGDAGLQKMQYAKKLEALYQHAASLATAETIDVVSRLTLDAMSRVLGFDFISFLVVVGENLLPIASRGAPLVDSLIPINGRGVVARTARTKTTQLVRDTRLDPDFFIGSTASLSELAVPIRLDEGVLAVINAESIELGSFNDEDVVLCELLAGNIASAIHRIRIRERLSDAETLTNILMNEIADGIYIISLDDRVIEVNQAVLTTYGYTREELRHLNVATLEEPEHRAHFPQLREALLKNRKNLFVTEAIARSGEKIPIEISTRLITYRGQPAVIGIARDLRERLKAEATIRESEQLYRTILENSPTPISISVQGRIVYANPSRMKLTGDLEIGDVDANQWAVVHPDDVNKLKQLDVMGTEGQLPSKSYEFRLRQSNGTYANIEALSIPINYREKPGVLHVLYDVTQRYQYEERLKALHRYAHDLAAVDTVDEAAQVVGRVVQEMLDSSFGSVGLVENDVLRFVHVYGVDWDEGGVMPINGPGITTRAVRTGSTQIISDATRDIDYFFAETDKVTTLSEIVVPIKVGGSVVATINVENQRVDAYTKEDVAILEMLGNHFSSAIERIRATEAREEYRNRLETLNELVLQLDSAQTAEETGRITSSLLRKLYQSEYDNVAFVEGDYLVSCKPDPQAVPRLSLNGGGISIRAIKEGRTICVGDVTKDPDYIKGDIEALSELVVPLRLRDQVVGIMNLESPLRDAFSAEDIKLAEALASHISATLGRIKLGEEQRASMEKALREEATAQRARETERLKTRFLSAATHEIRTPLTSINGYTNLIQEALEAGDVSKARAYFEVVKRNAERLTRLTYDLLDTQRLEEGQMSLSRVSTRSRDLLAEVVKEVTPILVARGQVVEVDDGFDGLIEVDPDRMHQVLSNLIGNASKFSPADATIWLSVEERDGELLVVVRDGGVGLSEEDIPKLFKPFPGIRVDGNREGTGLGLSICGGIVELHGGRIWAKSPGMGKGSVFSFTIPLQHEA